MADQADRLRLGDSERLAKQKISRRQATAGHSRQEQRTCRFRDQPEVDEREGESRSLLRDDEIAVKQHGRSDSDAIAVNRGDERRFATCERSEKAPDRDLVSFAAGGLEEVGEIVPGREILPLAPKGDEPH